VYVYEEGLWEELTYSGAWQLYPFNGQVVARRDVHVNTAVFLHGDHLGSMTWATNASGNAVGGQEYGPWGNVRAGSGSLLSTGLNYTGQYLDGTGLLYYHARYYDPVLGRFISADSVVPGNASGSMDGVGLKALTVDFHEPGFVGQLNMENNGGDEKLYRMGPQNPQALNRYSYVQNNPLKYTDPTGHTLYLSKQEAADFSAYLVELADILSENEGHPSKDALDAAKDMIGWASGPLVGAIENLIDSIVGDPGRLRWEKISRIRELSDRIDDVNALSEEGVAIGGGGNSSYEFNMWVLNRGTGDMMKVDLGWTLYYATFGGGSIFDIGTAYGGNANDGWHFVDDVDGRDMASSTCPEDSSGC
jgi:RHS repeat-associated protein